VKLKEAIELIVELAEDNVLDGEDPQLSPELKKQAEFQDDAFGIVSDFTCLL
jgi:hypothetical protein